jgi:hypothetical protein
VSEVPPGAAAEVPGACGGSGRAAGEKGGGRRAEAEEEEEEGGTAARSAGVVAESEEMEAAGGVGAATEGGGGGGESQRQQQRPAVQQYRPMPGSDVVPPSRNAPRVVAGMNMDLDSSTAAGEDGGVKGIKPRGKDQKTRQPRKCKRCVKNGGAAPSECTGASTRKTEGDCDYFHASGKAK